MLKQVVAAIGLALVQGDPAMPDPSTYYVTLDGETVFQTKSKRQAIARYEQIKKERLGDRATPRLTPEEAHAALARERASMQVAGMLAESSKRKRDKATARGGRGGRGGA